MASILETREADTYAAYPTFPTTASEPGSPRILVQVGVWQVALGVFAGMWAFGITAGIAYVVVDKLTH